MGPSGASLVIVTLSPSSRLEALAKAAPDCDSKPSIPWGSEHPPYRLSIWGKTSHLLTSFSPCPCPTIQALSVCTSQAEACFMGSDNESRTLQVNYRVCSWCFTGRVTCIQKSCLHTYTTDCVYIVRKLYIGMFPYRLFIYVEVSILTFKSPLISKAQTLTNFKETAKEWIKRS